MELQTKQQDLSMSKKIKPELLAGYRINERNKQMEGEAQFLERLWICLEVDQWWSELTSSVQRQSSQSVLKSAPWAVKLNKVFKVFKRICLKFLKRRKRKKKPLYRVQQPRTSKIILTTKALLNLTHINHLKSNHPLKQSPFYKKALQKANFHRHLRQKIQAQLHCRNPKLSQRK